MTTAKAFLIKNFSSKNVKLGNLDSTQIAIILLILIQITDKVFLMTKLCISVIKISKLLENVRNQLEQSLLVKPYRKNKVFGQIS